ncbi:MAG TPA: dihydropteroate synthase [Aestuariivirgaceae bacterium]|jgi:dihydropteroate synthase
MTRFYIRPMGLLAGEDADAAVAQGTAGRIGGGGIAFALVELIIREGPRIERAHRSFREVSSSRESSIGEKLGLILEPRTAVAGVDMTQASIMGIINVTPDSFSDGGEAARKEDAIARGIEFAKDGAAIIDVGGESTRPGSDGISIDEERCRVLTVISELGGRGLKVSIDTRKPQIMEEAVKAGAAMINDVTALRFDPESRRTAAKLKRPVCLMHAQGDPKTMQNNPVYEDVVLDVFDELQDLIEKAVSAGLPRGLLLADPGIGFGKTYRHNLEILQKLSVYHGLGVPLVVGASRKAFIGAITGEPAGKARAHGSVGMAIAAAGQGAQILRVHDVKATSQALKAWRAATEPSALRL